MEKKYNCLDLPSHLTSTQLRTFELTMTLVTLRKMESQRPLTSKQDQKKKKKKNLATGVGHCVKKNVNTFWKAYLVRHHGPWHQEGFKWIKHAWWVYITLFMKKRKFKIMLNLAKMLQNRVLAPTWSKWHKTGILGSFKKKIVNTTKISIRFYLK